MLLAQIASLRQQIALLIGNFHPGSDNASSTPNGVGHHSCPIPNRNLGIGSKGDDVKELQQFLSQDDPEEFSEDNATGFFGPFTAKAMMHFQERHGIASTTTGFVGPLTRGFFGKHCGEVEDRGHLKDTSGLWMDFSTTTARKPVMRGQENHDQHEASSTKRDNSDH
jgi:peptidoglycan hydrolase-like protein with peptidoglycan-binding domain